MRELKINTGSTKVKYQPWPDFWHVKNYFNNLEKPLPDNVIRIEEALDIADGKKFVASHIEIIQANDGNPTFRTYLDRLIKYKNKLEELTDEEWIVKKPFSKNAEEVPAVEEVGQKKRKFDNIFE